VHAAVQRATKSDLAYEAEDRVRVHIRKLEEILVHGMRYYFVPERGARSRGMVTLTSAPPFAALFLDSDEPIVGQIHPATRGASPLHLYTNQRQEQLNAIRNSMNLWSSRMGYEPATSHN